MVDTKTYTEYTHQIDTGYINTSINDVKQEKDGNELLHFEQNFSIYSIFIISFDIIILLYKSNIHNTTSINFLIGIWIDE